MAEAGGDVHVLEPAPVTTAPPRPRHAVAVIIPCRDEAATVGRLLEAVRGQDATVDEIVLVDSGSTDASVTIARAFASRHPALVFRVVTCDSPGAAAAMNAGVRASTADVIVRLDGHSEPPPTYVSQCLAALDEPGAGVVGGVWDIQPSAPTTVARAIALALAHRLGTGSAAYRHATKRPERRDVDTVPFGTFTRQHWQAIGGYDESLLTNEDYEFNYRTRLAGKRVILDTGIRCGYFSRPTLAALAHQYFRWGWWKAQMLRRYPESAKLRQVIPVFFVAALAGSALLGLLWWPFWIACAGLAALYGGAIGLASWQVAREGRSLALLPPAAVAFCVIHLWWGGAGLINRLTFGRWPAWADTRRAVHRSSEAA